jgi:hypothetical protein
VWFPVYNNLHKPTTLEMETEDLLVFLFEISKSMPPRTLPKLRMVLRAYSATLLPLTVRTQILHTVQGQPSHEKRESR